MKKYIYKSIGLLLAIVTLSSCLKDDSLVLDPDKGTNVIEFQNLSEIVVHGSTIPLYSLSFEIANTPTIVPLTVSYSGPADGAPEDITINMGLGTQTMINNYNTEQGKTGAVGASNEPYVILPSNMFSLTSNSVVIRKGQKTATMNLSLNTSLFVIGVPYVVPLQITGTSSGTISGNFSKILVNVVPKNKYDGVYQSIAGTIQRYSAPTTPTVGDALNGSLAGNKDVSLVTLGANVNRITGLQWASNGGAVGGVDPILLTVDPATNLVTLSSGTAPSLKAIVGKDNKYDPATKTFTLNFDWNQTANKREVLGLVLKFKGARP
ncbi:DUF1735 domain-containing protein [Pedobacter frigiditerrae]|uniref:DUF1735 domain-containing protein n=1 Tax=Pedobacter frigiditerrae TaxID=2530452 RepID=A0A4R0MVY9_9SPHI|nr:DUF1735 domain-containing protein [Pedobacter frigiditerrae]TCC90084.1 DUF1735 domain-containing protein [Pedobacter frigiditerrae]